VWSLGSLIGPVAGGIVVDILGFSLASFIIVLAFLITAFFFALFHLFSKAESYSINFSQPYEEIAPIMDDYQDDSLLQG